MDRGAWRAAVLGVAKSRTRMKGLNTHAYGATPYPFFGHPVLCHSHRTSPALRHSPHWSVSRALSCYTTETLCSFSDNSPVSSPQHSLETTLLSVSMHLTSLGTPDEWNDTLLSLCVCFIITHSILSSRFIHTGAGFRISFLFKAFLSDPFLVGS